MGKFLINVRGIRCVMLFVEELELENPEEYIRNKFKGKEVSYEKTVLEDGTIIFDITTSQIKQRCSFTEI